MGNRNIVIKGNRFFCDYQGDVDAAWADGVTVEGNVITGAPAWPESIRAQPVVSLSHCRAVTFQGNMVKHASAYQPALVSLGADVPGVRHGDAAGLRAAP